ncbi:MAG: hypothetical protein ACUVS3_10295 [Thermodesulfobacteriota bacterium]
MAQIIDIREGALRQARGRLFLEWAQRAGHRVEPGTTLGQLSDGLLWILAQADLKGNSLLEELIVLIRLGTRRPSSSLSPELRLEILDFSLFLLDQARFECMVRLGWIEPLPARDLPLVQLLCLPLERLREIKESPRLREDHPQFHWFQRLSSLDKETFLRRQIPHALELFRRRVHGSG